MTSPIMPFGYYDQFNSNKNYDETLFIAGFGLQSTELNEIQSNLKNRVKGIADSLFKDGNIVRDAGITITASSGAVIANSGAIYVSGAVRGVAPKTFTIPTTGTVQIGIYLISSVITALEDPSLLDPASGTRNYSQPGASRLKVDAIWGFTGDGNSADFYGVYTVIDGVMLSKEVPPNLDSVTQAIARYDRDSSGGSYIVSGLGVSASLNAAAGSLTTIVLEGSARVNGFGIVVAQSIRHIESIDRDVQVVLADPAIFNPAADGTMRFNFSHSPSTSLDRVQITAQKTASITHKGYTGSSDPLPDNSILSIISVKQESTTYTAGTDYKLTAGEVDWTPSGSEPAPGSTYDVIYQYLTAGKTTDLDAHGFTVSGAVAGSLVTVDYKFALPRADAIVFDDTGLVSRVKGVSNQYSPAPPRIPGTKLRIATLWHNWITDPVVTLDAIIVMPMGQLQGMRSMIMDLYDLVAQQQLNTAIGLSEPAAKRGVFVDPFTNNNLRDAGVAQTATIIDEMLMLPIAPKITAIGSSIITPATLDYTVEVLISQRDRTGNMNVNPYQAFEPLPSLMTLHPSVDFWTETSTIWDDTTADFVNATGDQSRSGTAVALVSSKLSNAKYLRQIYVDFTLTNFSPGENLRMLMFDGLLVLPESI